MEKTVLNARDNAPVLQTETIRECPLCGKCDLRIWRKGRDLLLGVSDQRFLYVRCRNCDLLFLSNRPTPDSIGLFYPQNYHPYSEPLVPGEIPKHRVSTLERFLEIIETKVFRSFRRNLLEQVERRFPDAFIPALQKFYRPPKRGAVLLDFGCGSAWFLNIQRNTRWSTIGMDFKEELVEQVRREGHRGILVSEAGWQEIEDESVDAARMNHVLEHLYDPKNVLSHILAKLRPGGAIHIAVPNPYGISARLFRSRWFGLEAPRHLMIYSPARLRRLLSDLGFVDVEVVHERTPKDFTRSIGYLLRDLRLVKPDKVQGMGDEALLNSWLAPLLWLSGGKGYGDRIHAFARKPAITTASVPAVVDQK
jgi:2-polyprenyl-3-methyl-5-hydroxy-6-metoxy-1,4-benzoquinol methylase